MNRLLTALALSAAAAACVAPSAGDCKTDADCLNGAACVDGLCRGGDVPTAKIDAPASVPFGGTVVLDGSGSTTGPGVRYEWKVLSPEGVALGDAGTAKPSFTAAVPHGTYTVQLLVRDRGTPSAPVTATIGVDNSVPVARLDAPAGPFLRGQTYVFDASKSADPDGDALVFEWSLGTTGAGYELKADGAKATLVTGPLAAAFQVAVKVTDPEGRSETAESKQTVNNAPPVVDAGQAVTVDHRCAGGLCTAEAALAATVRDGDGGKIVPSTVGWRLKSAPPAAGEAPAAITPGDGANASIRITTPDTAPIAGDYEFELSAGDDDGAVTKASVVVTVGNQPPVITLGGPAPLGVDHAFDAAGSAFVATIAPAVVATDPDGDRLAFEFLPMSAVTPAAAQVEVRQGTDSGAAGSYVVRVDRAQPGALAGPAAAYSADVRVTDLNGGIAADSRPVVIGNRAPVAPAPYDVGADAPQHAFGAPPGTTAANMYWRTFAFPYALTDPDGDPLDGAWTVAAPAQATAAGTLAAPELTAYGPDASIVTTRLVATLSARDPFGADVSGEVGLLMGNRPPPAPALAPQTAPGHAYGTLDWAGPSPGFHQTFAVTVPTPADPDGDAVQLAFSYAAAVPVQGRATGPGAGGEWTVQLFSTDPLIFQLPVRVTASAADGFASAASTAEFSFRNQPPVLAAPARQDLIGHSYGVPAASLWAGPTLAAGFYAVFDASAAVASDPDGDPVSLAAQVLPPAGVPMPNSALSGDAAARTLLVHSTDKAIVGAALTAKLTATDAGGMIATASAPVSMGNRAPVVGALPGGSSTGHVYGTPASAPQLGTGYYVDAFDLAAVAVSDPDGDPIVRESAVATANGVTLVSALLTPLGAARKVLVHSTSAGVLTNEVSLKLTATDAVGAVSAASTGAYRLGNNAPVVTAFLPQSSPGHVYGDPGWRPVRGAGYYQNYAVKYQVSDPDGDPLGTPVVTAVWVDPANKDNVVTYEANLNLATNTLSLFSSDVTIVGRNLGVGVAVADVAGKSGSASSAWPAAMGNRPPAAINPDLTLVVPYGGGRWSCSAGPGGSDLSCTVSSGNVSRSNYFFNFLTGLCSASGANYTQFSSPSGTGYLRPSVFAQPVDPDGDPVTVSFSFRGSSAASDQLLNAGLVSVAGFVLSCPGSTPGTLTTTCAPPGLAPGTREQTHSIGLTITPSCRGLPVAAATMVGVTGGSAATPPHTFEMTATDAAGGVLRGSISLTVQK